MFALLLARLLLLQEKAKQRAEQLSYVDQAGNSRTPSIMPAVLSVLVRLRQACIHSSLLPTEIQPIASQPDTSSAADDSSAESPSMAYATPLERIQAKRIQSTKLERVVQIVQVPS